MKVRVQYMAQLRAAAGTSEEEVELPDASSIVTLLEHLVDLHGSSVKPHLLSQGGLPQPGLLIAVNGAALPRTALATSTLRENDTVMLMPPIAGG